MPIEYKDLDNFILSQFSSVIVIPDAIPKTWVYTAVDAAVLHMSELLTTTDGALAVGTDLSVTTVEDTVFVSAAIIGRAYTDIIISTVSITKFLNQNLIYVPNDESLYFIPFIGNASKGKQNESTTIDSLYFFVLLS